MMKNLDKNSKIMVLVGIILVVFLVFMLISAKNPGNKGYSVIYLSTGEVYLGKISNFPRMTMKDGYILQIVKDATDPSKSSFQLNPLKEAVWSPTKLFLNRDQVLFYGPINKDSKVAQGLAGLVK